MPIATIHFDYTSAKGEQTSRTVDVEELSRESMSGHCHLREKQRPFYFARMRNCIDTDTGQIISDIFPFLCISTRVSALDFDFLSHQFPDEKQFMELVDGLASNKDPRLEAVIRYAEELAKIPKDGGALEWKAVSYMKSRV